MSVGELAAAAGTVTVLLAAVEIVRRVLLRPAWRFAKRAARTIRELEAANLHVELRAAGVDRAATRELAAQALTALAVVEGRLSHLEHRQALVADELTTWRQRLNELGIERRRRTS